jgi:hypothetical protein
LQKGPLQRTVRVLVHCVIALSVLTPCSWAQPAGGRYHMYTKPSALRGPMHMTSSGRLFIDYARPGQSGLMFTAAAPPDENLSNNAAQNLDPSASPVTTQNRIAFSSNGLDTDANGQIDSVGTTFNLWIMRSDGSEQTQVTLPAALTGDKREPAYDPNGQYLAFSRQVGGVWQIYTVLLANPSQVVQVTSGTDNKRHPTWSPDAQYIVYQSDSGGGSHLFITPVNGAGLPVQLTATTAADSDPVWSPGPRILFTRQVVGQPNRVWALDPGGATAQMTSGGGDATVADQEPAWRPNGTEFAFASNRIPASPGTADFNIWRVVTAGETGGGTANLVSNTSVADTADDTNPTWTTDLNQMPMRIGFVSLRSGVANIWARQLTDNLPPTLGTLPTLDTRTPSPGGTVTISVPVADATSGVALVQAYIKVPDSKPAVLPYFPIWFHSLGNSFDSGLDLGERFLEYDCQNIATVTLTDPDLDGIYTGTYTTPAAPAQDYIIDIHVQDNDGNALTYDDIFGFSTISNYVPTHDILFVDDYCEGQKFIGNLGFPIDFTAGYAVESYFTSNPGTYPGVTNIDTNTLAGAIQQPGTPYDVWRVLCRGPVTAAVFQHYLPTFEMQLDPAEIGTGNGDTSQPTRPVAVANRAIVWAAPHTGNLAVTEGTLLDPATQIALTSFQTAGGRLFFAGQDIAWGLHQSGGGGDAFLSSVLKATFLNDDAANDFALGGVLHDPVAYDPWDGLHYVAPFDPEAPMSLLSAKGTQLSTTKPWFNDCSQYSIRPDSIVETGGATKIYGYGQNSVPAVGGATAAVRWQDTVGNGARLVYLAFGFEQINRGLYTPTGFTLRSKNHRSHLLRNAISWLRTGSLAGHVLSISGGGNPINGPAPIVIATSGTASFSVRCQSDGRYLMQGLPAGNYTVDVRRSGYYSVDHGAKPISIDGGQGPYNMDFAMSSNPPGAITGTVTAAATGDPLANVAITVTRGLPPVVVGTTITAGDGTYTIAGVAEGPVTVEADGTAQGYSIATQSVTVVSAQTATANFALTAAPGTLTVNVNEAAPPNGPIEGALVLAVATGGGTFTGTTNAGGTVDLTVPPGAYTVTVTASGHITPTSQTASILPAGTFTLNFSMTVEPPGSIEGATRSSGSGAFMGGVTITVKSGALVVGTTTTSASAVPGEVLYNYRVDNVPTGQLTVEATKTGATANPTSQTVTVNTGQITKNVNFTMSSLRTFPIGLQLMSLPYDYPVTNPATLLNVPVGLQMATWPPIGYAYYPNPPADFFRLGRGYWLRLTSPSDLFQAGDPLTATSFEIQLDSGWNLIGNPFGKYVGVPGRSKDVPIDYYTAHVRDALSIVRTIPQALADGVLGSNPFAYIFGGYQNVGVLSPYVGYWLRANQPCWLILDETIGGLSAKSVERPGQLTPAGGWLLQLRTSVGPLLDTATYLGAAPQATAGLDTTLDQPKPPSPSLDAYVYTAVDNQSWTKGSGDYAVDIRPLDTKNTWALSVRTNQVGQQVPLSWPDLSSLPHSVRPILTDLDSGQSVYLRTVNSYSFTAGTEPRRLQMTVDAAGVGQLLISGASAANTPAGVALTYSLSRAAAVDVTVCNIAGRPVRQVVSDLQQVSGQNVVLWDGRNQNGLRVPPGRYLVNLTARTETGQESRTIVPFNYTGR